MEAREMNEERKNGGDGNGDVGGNGDPQFTTPGAGEQLDETVAEAGGPIPGPMEGQGGERQEPEMEPERAAPRRTAAPRKKKKAAPARAKKKAGKARKAAPARRARGAAKKSKGKART